MGKYSESITTLSRRSFLERTGLGLGAAALGELLLHDGVAQSVPTRQGPVNPLRPQTTDWPARAKSVIYLHMVGAPSHLDLFDYKPELTRRDGQLCPDEFIAGKRFAFLRGHPKLMGPRFPFEQHGQSGQYLSELLPHMAGQSDKIAFLKTVRTEEFNHAPAQLFLHTGFGQLGRPSLGSWLTYGLGSENRDLPTYVVLRTGPMAGAGSSLWSPGFLPSVYQGIEFRSKGDPVLFLSNPKGYARKDRRRLLDTVQALNAEQLQKNGDPEIATRISQYEMAFRMQVSVPELMDIGQESKTTLDVYGANPGQRSFANNCLLARRLVERGVRIVQLFDSGWDHHSNLAKSLPGKCRQVDQPIAALLADLQERGLLDQTLVVWGSEFGRTPMLQVDNGDGARTAPGRDHHKEAYTMWMAGGGVKPGISYGRTDEFGYNAVENPVHVHDVNATALRLLGLHHENLTYRYQGRDFRLTDVHGEAIQGVMA